MAHWSYSERLQHSGMAEWTRQRLFDRIERGRHRHIAGLWRWERLQQRYQWSSLRRKGTGPPRVDHSHYGAHADKQSAVRSNVLGYDCLFPKGAQQFFRRPIWNDCRLKRGVGIELHDFRIGRVLGIHGSPG